MSVRHCIAALALCQLAAAQSDLSQAAVDQLLVRLSESSTASAAASELLHHGRAAVPALTQRLLAIGAEDNTEAWVAPSLQVLARMGPDAAGALDALLELPQRPDRREMMLEALGRIAPHIERRAQVEAAVWDLYRLFRPNRAPFIPCLQRLGFDATVPTERLLAGLRDRGPFVRQLVCETLVLRHRRGSLTEQDRATSCEHLQKAIAGRHPHSASLQDDQGRYGVRVDQATVVHAASIALATLAPELPESRAGHRLLLRDLDVRVRAKAAHDLGVAGAGASNAAEELTSALESDVLVAREAATALGLVGVDDARVLAGLAAASRSADAQLAARAAAALRQLAAGRK